MRRGIFLVLVLLLTSIHSKAQLVSLFRWDSGPVTQADAGPNGISASSSAISDNGGSAGTKGLNPGLPKKDVELELDGSYFDLEGMSIEFDYQREEGTAHFFDRGSNFSLKMNGGKISVTFQLDNGMGGYTTVSSGPMYTVPLDDTWRTYKFVYDPTVGEATFTVNGTNYWTYTGTPGQLMYWTGAGNAFIGILMDSNGNNKTTLDNFEIHDVPNSPLSMQLQAFDANLHHGQVQVDWETVSEHNHAQFLIERAIDNYGFEEIGEVSPAGLHGNGSSYQFIDRQPLPGVSFYRLVAIDNAGEREEYPAVEVFYHLDQFHNSIHPSPVISDLFLDIEAPGDTDMDYQILDGTGILFLSGHHHLIPGHNEMDITEVDELRPGFYILSIHEGIESETISFVKVR